MTKAPNCVGAFESEQGELFELPEFSPVWPKSGTLVSCALAMLMEGRAPDHPDFEVATISWRLAAVVFDLRSLGWPIRAVQIPAPNDAHPNRYVAVYSLPMHTLAKALPAVGRATA